jgi:Dolichyl-phosphate-mannose-protein mannosyltransferase
MQIVRKYRILALFCALAVLLCELLAHPVANMGIMDDGAYVPMVRTLAATGHVAYTGWAAGMLGWQLYLAAALTKVFGFSFTAVRSSTLLVAMALAFTFQRSLVCAGISERNATFGTLALVLSPLYLMLSVTFMSDIFGLFAIALCLYGCLRALLSRTDRASIAWLCFAVATNAVFGTSRQISWLGILVMVPSTLWLLRGRRRVLIAGSAAALAGALFLVACLHWLQHQPYVVAEHLDLKTFSSVHFLVQLIYFLLDAPFLVLPVLALFLPNLRNTRLRLLLPLCALLLAYVVLAMYPSHLRGYFFLGPVGECVNPSASFAFPILRGTSPQFLPRSIQALLPFVAFGGLLGLFIQLYRSRGTPSPLESPAAPSWQQLRILLLPFSLAYTFLICERGVFFAFHDRYLLGLLLVVILCLVRYYQEHAPTRLPVAAVLLLAFIAIYSIVANHHMFAFYRARATLASNLVAAGVPLTVVDNGWEYNFGVELQYAGHINGFGIEWPPHARLPILPEPAGACPMNFAEETPHIRPLYGVSLDPNACYGPAPFAPIHYSRWPYRTPGTLYVIRYLPPPPPEPARRTLYPE